MAQAARDGFALVIRPDTPVFPDEKFPFESYHPLLTERRTWSEIETLARYWGDVGCGWVNLRFAIDDAGNAVVRYEAKPDGEPLPDGGIPGFNGGFDTRQLVSDEEWRRLYPGPGQESSDPEAPQ
jgi:hypothetical protein